MASLKKGGLREGHCLQQIMAITKAKSAHIPWAKVIQMDPLPFG